MNTFEKLLAGLSQARIDVVVVVGGLEVAYCGHVRNTLDVDLFICADEENAARMLGCLEDFGEGHARKLSPGDFTLEEGAVRIVEDFPLDLFTQTSGHTYEDLPLLTAERAVAGQRLRHLSAEGLILLKENSLRPKNQMDVQVLCDLQHEQDDP